MKLKTTQRNWIPVIALLAIVTAPLANAGLNPAFRKAKGTYNVRLSANGNAPGFGNQGASGYPGVLRLPAKNGNLILKGKVDGRSVSIPGKITSAKVRRGGKVVAYSGVTRVPASALSQIPADIRSQDPDELLAQIPAQYRALIPKSLINQFKQGGFEAVAGSLTAPFRATVNLKGARPSVVATTELSVAGTRAKARAVGFQR